MSENRLSVSEFPFGVTFYPDLVPEDTWDDNFARIAQSGFNIVRFGEMAWNWVEPRPGRFDFKGMDRALDLANKHGLKVVLGIATSQGPSWLLKEYPDARPVADDGALYPDYGPRPNICRDHPGFQKLAERLIRKVVGRYKNHPAVAYWQIDNEPVIPPLDSTTPKDFCHCPHTQQAFRGWARHKFKGDLAELNRVWGTKFWTVEFGRWEDITTPKCGVWDAGNPHIFLDWFRFKSEMLAGWVRHEAQLVKKIDSKRPVGTNGFIGICTRVPDHHLLAEGLDWYGWDIYPRGGKNTPAGVARMADWWRSIAESRGAQFHVTELQGGPNVRWGYPGPVLGPEIRLWTHQVVAHGAQALLYHCWRTALYGGETGGFGILKPDGSPTTRLESIEEALAEVARVIPILKKFRPAPRVGIAYLRSADVQVYQEQGPPRGIAGQWETVRTDIGLTHGLDSLKGAHALVNGHSNPIKIIFEQQLEAGPPDVEILLLPNPYILTERQAAFLGKFIDDGGVLITEARCGMKDASGHLHQKPLLEKLFGVLHDRTEVIEEPLEVTGGPGEHAAGWAYGFRDVVNSWMGNVAFFPDGQPALIERRSGHGRALYATFSLFMSLLKPGNEGLAEFIRTMILPLPKVRWDGPRSVETVVWESTTLGSPGSGTAGGEILIYAINHSEAPAEGTLYLPLGAANAAAHIGPDTIQIKDDKIALKFEGREVRVLTVSLSRSPKSEGIPVASNRQK